MRAVRFDEATTKDLDRVEGPTHVRNYIGGARELRDGPSAVLVNVPNEDSFISPHFHDVDQFQVTVGGEGSLGKNRLTPVTFQYVNSYTPYGPIHAGKNGLSYFTLRITSAGGHYHVPAYQDMVKGKKKRSIMGSVQPSSTPVAAGKVVRSEIIETETDGVSVVNLRLGANARQSGSVTPATGGGQFWLVTGGSVVQDGKTLPTLSVIHVEANDPPPAVEAGPEGAEILVVQFPRPSDRPGSDPRKMVRPEVYVATAAPSRTGH